jgi:hypothetical protein
MQLMPETAQEIGANMYDPRQNVMGGTKYLKKQLDSFGGDLRLALAAYNAGPQAVKDHGNNVPPYEETRNYIKKIMGFLHGVDNPYTSDAGKKEDVKLSRMMSLDKVNADLHSANMEKLRLEQEMYGVSLKNNTAIQDEYTRAIKESDASVSEYTKYLEEMNASIKKPTIADVVKKLKEENADWDSFSSEKRVQMTRDRQDEIAMIMNKSYADIRENVEKTEHALAEETKRNAKLKLDAYKQVISGIKELHSREMSMLEANAKLKLLAKGALAPEHEADLITIEKLRLAVKQTEEEYNKIKEVSKDEKVILDAKVAMEQTRYDLLKAEVDQINKLYNAQKQLSGLKYDIAVGKLGDGNNGNPDMAINWNRIKDLDIAKAKADLDAAVQAMEEFKKTVGATGLSYEEMMAKFGDNEKWLALVKNLQDSSNAFAKANDKMYDVRKFWADSVIDMAFEGKSFGRHIAA